MSQDDSGVNNSTNQPGQANADEQFDRFLKAQMDSYFKRIATRSDNDAGSSPHLSMTAKVSVKIPAFLPNSPDLWFWQIESQFRNNGITADQTKFDTVLGSLDANCLEALSDLMRNPPTQDKYETLKRKLISEYSESSHKKLQRLLQGVELGDLKPSTLLRKMKELAGSSMTDDTVESLWLSKLPQTTRAIVASIPTNLSSKAETADQIMDLTRIDTCSSLSSAPPKPEIEHTVFEMAKKMDLLLSQDRSRSHRSPSRTRRFSRDRPRRRSMSRNHDQCWYHHRFGDNAKNCQEGCKHFKNQKN